jgi:hypothetical protein
VAKILRLFWPSTLLLLGACDVFTDCATRIAYDIEADVGRLGNVEGSIYSIRHTPADNDECGGPYTVQLDKVGALIVWCKDAAGNTVASGSTSYHSRFIDTPQTYKLDKPAGSTLIINVERRNGRAVVTGVT